LRPEHVEHNQGDLPIGIAPEDVPTPTLDVAETIRSIEESGSWMALKFIENMPEYRELLMETLASIEPAVQGKTGAMEQLEGFVFVSSPGAVTPFHFDPEHNILLQIRGNKVLTTFPAADESIVPPQDHESFAYGEHHRNLVWNDDMSAHGNPIPLTAGEALYVPVKMPHWVKNGPEVSISLSVTWRSEWSVAESEARALNALLRGAGLSPASPKRWPATNFGKSAAFRALRKTGVAKVARSLLG
ncbi:MAG: cupin-like domain-containing protein, partial [Pontixanthobacter sp.]